MNGKLPASARLFALGCLALAVTLAGCPKDEEKTTGPDNPTNNLSGLVAGTVSGRALAGLTVSANGVSTRTGGDGSFVLEDVGSGDMLVSITGGGIVPRNEFVPANASGLVGSVASAAGAALEARGVAVPTPPRAAGAVILDAIDQGTGFNLAFYREIARGNHPREGNMNPIVRWTNPTPPTVYIDTNASSVIDGRIDQNTINVVRNVITQMAPIWTGGLYRTVNVVTQRFPDSLVDLEQDQLSPGLVPDNAIVITFDDALANLPAYGIGLNDATWSGTIRPVTKAIIILVDHPSLYAGFTLQEAVSHESGHIFGFWHTSTILPSVMVKEGEFGSLYSQADVLHAAVMYRRPVGNTDTDNDPAGGGPRYAASLRGALHFDRLRAPVPPEIAARIRELRPRFPYQSLF